MQYFILNKKKKSTATIDFSRDTHNMETTALESSGFKKIIFWFYKNFKFSQNFNDSFISKTILQ